MSTNNLSSLNRTSNLSKAASTEYDLIIIGGGVTGCGIALDATTRGLKTLLVEKRDFASGTSSKSTKLIHGGLRYLKQLDFGLVRETGTERAVVHRLAPHIVLPEKMLMPLVEGGTYGKFATALGLTVYDILAGVKGDDRRVMLNKKKTLQLEPLLEAKGLKGGGFYAEYRTDDARLTIELIKTAVKNGALALNYATVNDFLYENDTVSGVKLTDELTGKSIEVKAKKVVSAGGPWVDRLRSKDGKVEGKRLHLTKGVHLVFPHHKIPLKHTVYFDGPDGRMIFAIPRGKTTYVGTTDTNYTGNLNRVVATKADAEYILKAIHHAFPSLEVGMEDIESNWAGLRPLIHQDGKSPSELSRKDEIFLSEKGLISIAGGKLTGYRKMAQRIVDLVTKQLKKESHMAFERCQTKDLYLTEKPFNNAKAVDTYIQKLSKEIQSLGLTAYHAWYLTTNYGRQSDIIIEKMKSFNDTPDIALGRAECWFCVHHELVSRVEDFFVRRTGALYFDIDRIEIIKDAILKDMTTYLEWNEERVFAEDQQLSELLYDAKNYYDQELN